MTYILLPFITLPSIIILLMISAALEHPQQHPASPERSEVRNGATDRATPFRALQLQAAREIGGSNTVTGNGYEWLMMTIKAG